jgi:uncharacterized membrane-anchored protein
MTIPARVFRAATAISAAALFAFGVICWIAANWPIFHRLTKLGLAGGVMLAAAAAALLIPRARAPALLLAVAASGGLLALIGQIYPSGADAWELFAYWTLLALPFALAARHNAVWALWVLVASAAIGLWHGQERNGAFAIGAVWPAWALAIGLALMLTPAARLQTLIGRANWGFRLASLGAIGWVTLTGIHALGGIGPASGRDGAAFFIALLTLLAAGGALARLRPLETGVLTLVFAGLDVLLIWRVFDFFGYGASRAGVMLVISLICAAIIGVSVALLHRIHARLGPARTPADKRAASWPLVALSGFGAVLAAVPVLMFFALLLDDPSHSLVLAVGALTLGGAILLLRGGAALGFRQIFGLIAAIAGIVLIGWGIYGVFRLPNFEELGVPLAAVIAVCAALVPAAWVRALCGLAVPPLLAAFVFTRAFSLPPGLTPALLILALLIVALGAAALVFAAPRARMLAAGPSQGQASGDETEHPAAPADGSAPDESGRLASPQARQPAGANAAGAWGPFFFGWNAAGLLMLIWLAGRPFLLGASMMNHNAGELTWVSWSGLATSVSIALGAAGLAFLFRRHADLRTPLGIAVAVCAVALTWRAPALGAAIMVFAAAVEVSSRGLVAAAALAAAWIISALYYSLAWPLVYKGYVLMGVGAALGLAVFLTRARGGEPVFAPRFAGAAAGCIALGALAVLGVAGSAAYSAERVLREGRVIYLALRPVDPRSLMQGDYMTLAFDTSRLPAARKFHGAVLALAGVDARSVATLRALVGAKLAPAGPLQPKPDEIVLKLRVKSGRWFVGSDAFFFKEGTGKNYEDAKFGRFRVGADGRMLLAGLADQNLKALP